MMLSGFNGYGKTSIFESIEFALSGKVKIFEFKDTNKKYSEHIAVNNLHEESLVALELFNQYTKKYISIIRYNSCVQPCKESECKKEFKGFSLYILDEEFNYENFITKKDRKEIGSKSTNELAEILKETNIDEWLNSNYIRQEQSSNILFKSNSERVNFVNQFIDKGCEEYFLGFEQEEKVLKESIITLKEDLKLLKSNITKIKVNSIGEKPESIILIKDDKLFWDKIEYSNEENFEQYLEELNNLNKIVENFEIYDMLDKSKGIDRLVSQSELLKKIIIYSCFENAMDCYISNYNKKKYLEGLIINKKVVLTYELNSEYLSKEIIEKINTIRKNNENINNLSDNKQKMYTETKNFREYVLKNIGTFENVFSNKCPLCGHDYGIEDLTLQKSVNNYSDLFKECSNILNESLKVLSSTIDNDYNNIKEEIKKIIETLQYEEDIYIYICDIKKDINKFKKCKERICLLLDEDINNFNNFTNLNINTIEMILKNILIKLKNQKEKYDKILKKSSDNIFDENMLSEDNKKKLTSLRSLNIDDFKSNVEIKMRCLQWHLAKKQFEKSSKDQLDFNQKLQKLKDLLIRQNKVRKVLECVKKAKNHYMDDIITYIEIPLYIYSGKLMQTHQNGLGVFCTTGPSEDKVTQFKLTTNGDGSGHDILNKFSTGQKAVINLAVMLSFRKIRRSLFDLFMIDDPCQSMDDINVASLTEILRNEFKDTQILISTHEESIAGYMCYKYYKSGNVYKNFNVQKELYPDII